MFYRQGDDKLSTLAWDALRGYGATMALGDFTTHRQADTRPLVIGAAVQALKHGEDAIDVLLIEPNAIVFYDDLPGLIVGTTAIAVLG